MTHKVGIHKIKLSVCCCFICPYQHWSIPRRGNCENIATEKFDYNFCWSWNLLSKRFQWTKVWGILHFVLFRQHVKSHNCWLFYFPINSCKLSLETWQLFEGNTNRRNTVYLFRCVVDKQACEGALGNLRNLSPLNQLTAWIYVSEIWILQKPALCWMDEIIPKWTPCLRCILFLGYQRNRKRQQSNLARE